MKILVKNLNTKLPYALDFVVDDNRAVRRSIPPNDEIDIQDLVTPDDVNKIVELREAVTNNQISIRTEVEENDVRPLIDNGRIIDAGYQEVTGISTISAVLEDITGLNFTLTIPAGQTAKIQADMTLQTSTTGGSPATGGWAISINSVDGTEMKRNLSGTNDVGLGCVKACSVVLPAGTYIIVGRHRRVNGTSTVNTDIGQLSAKAILEI